jgi:hypothetical protein
MGYFRGFLDIGVSSAGAKKHRLQSSRVTDHVVGFYPTT